MYSLFSSHAKSYDCLDCFQLIIIKSQSLGYSERQDQGENKNGQLVVRTRLNKISLLFDIFKVQKHICKFSLEMNRIGEIEKRQGSHVHFTSTPAYMMIKATKAILGHLPFVFDASQLFFVTDFNKLNAGQQTFNVKRLQQV